MRVCYLHIGLHKCASTSIQNMIYANVDRLAEAGLYVTRTATNRYRTHQHAIALELNGRPGATTGNIAALADELKVAGQPERIVVTSETFNKGVESAETRQRLRDLFAGMGYGLRTLALIRPQESLVNSIYTQQLKAFQFIPPMSNVADSTRERLRLDFSRFLLPMCREPEFGLSVLPLTPDMDVHAAFLDWLGVPATARDAFTRPAIANRTPGPKTVALYERIHAAFGKPINDIPRPTRIAASKQLRAAADEAGWNEHSYFGLTTRQVETIQQRHTQSNDAFAREVWGKRWADVFPPAQRACNIFDYDTASSAERDEFDAMTEQIIRALANTPTTQSG